MYRFFLPLFGLVIALTACQTTEPDEYASTAQDVPFSGRSKTIDYDRSSITFIGKSSIVDHEGYFDVFDVQLGLDSDEAISFERAGITVAIDVSSIQTDSDGLRKHLLREDFFDAENHPFVTFESTDITNKGENRYAIDGNIAIKGVSKGVVFDAAVTDTELILHYDLPRQEFGIGNDSYGNKLLDGLVPVDVHLFFE